MREKNPGDISELDYVLGEFDTGFRIGKYEPGNTIFDFLEMPSYEIGDKYMSISDTVWGDELIGDKQFDPLLIELARMPLFSRAQGIEQLTSGAKYASIPNTMYFSRWQHIWGSLVFVRKMTDGDDRFTPRESMVLQLRTLLSDLGHTAFSHLGDHIKQGPGGGEDAHDKDLKHILTITGVSVILEKYGFDLDEVVFPEVQDWAERSLPGLCVDRVDYSLRELLRWADFLQLSKFKSALHNPKALFEITPDKELAIKSPAFARLFAAGYGLLPTEHWGHPIQRLQFEMLSLAVKNAAMLEAQYGESLRHALYGVDVQYTNWFKSWETVHVEKMMADIAYSQRTIFINARRPDLSQVFGEFVFNAKTDHPFPEFPDPLKSYSWESENYGGPYPPQVEIAESKLALNGMRAVSRGLQLALPPFKPRTIDPLVKNNSVYSPLSTIDSTYEPYIEGQKKIMQRHYLVTVLMRKVVAEKITAQAQAIDKDWQAGLNIPNNDKMFAERIKNVGPTAIGMGFDRVRDTEDEDILRRYGR
jgi:hypothetical protein